MKKINIKFQEEELEFGSTYQTGFEKEKDVLIEKGVFDDDLPESELEPEVFGIKIRLGNEPIVYSLKRLMEISNSTLPAEIMAQFENRDVYLITHAIGVARVQGKAKVKELQYNSEVINLRGAVTIDLLPKTKFNTALQVEIGLSGAVKAAGNFSAEIPEELTKSLSGNNLSLGGDLELELSTNTKFVGKINYSIQLPVVQSVGVASNMCTWIIRPDDHPLLGDQLMVQTIAVPKGTSELTYEIKGLVKVDRGLFYRTEIKETSTQTISVKLN